MFYNLNYNLVYKFYLITNCNLFCIFCIQYCQHNHHNSQKQDMIRTNLQKDSFQFCISCIQLNQLAHYKYHSQCDREVYKFHHFKVRIHLYILCKLCYQSKQGNLIVMGKLNIILDLKINMILLYMRCTLSYHLKLNIINKNYDKYNWYTPFLYLIQVYFQKDHMTLLLFLQSLIHYLSMSKMVCNLCNIKII